MRYIHVSIDDVSEVVRECIRKEISITEHLFFKWLIKLNREYGLCVSLYMQNWGEFEKYDYLFCNVNMDNINWLKVGIHTSHDGCDFTDLNYDEGKNEWDGFCKMIFHNGGDEQIIDRFPRLHTFSGNCYCLEGMRDAVYCSAIGFLTSDDERVSYYIPEAVNKQLHDSPYVGLDSTLGLYFRPTDLRLDWFNPRFESKYKYVRPCKNKPYKEVAFHYEAGDYDDKEMITVFTHEWQIYKNRRMTRRKKWIEDICKFCKKNSIKFDFPENVLEGRPIYFFES